MTQDINKFLEVRGVGGDAEGPKILPPISTALIIFTITSRYHERFHQNLCTPLHYDL
jgi:hypothetical protein